MARIRKQRAHGGLGELGALRITDPDEWEKRVRAALKKTEGNIPSAAPILGISVRQIWRVLADKRFKDVAPTAHGDTPAEKPARRRGARPLHAPHHSPGVTELGALRVADHVEWRRKLKDAIKEADGSIKGAAEILGVDRRQMFRWLALEPSLRPS